LQATVYTCAGASTCPSNFAKGNIGVAYSCCSTNNCNTGNVAFPGISCYSGSTGSVNQVYGCNTVCQVF